MSTNLRQTVRKMVNSALGEVGFELVRIDHEFQDYIDLRKTLREAQLAQMPLGEYIDRTYNVPGATQQTIDALEEIGVFETPIERVSELGPGSGRYLEKINEICNPKYYEIYETAVDWRDWLVQTYHVTAHLPDGQSLPNTPSRSIDLIHTHKMLYGNPIITICRYFAEMARVVRENGWIVFDIVTEDCLTDEWLNQWIESGVDHACSMTAKQFAIDYFTSRGLSFKGSFHIPMAPGITEYMVFQKSN